MEQSRIRPDAPWLQFLDARYRSLLAYQSLEKIRRLVPGADPGAAADDPLRSAFLQLTHALDRVTVPLEVRKRHWQLGRSDADVCTSNSTGQNDRMRTSRGKKSTPQCWAP